MVRGNDRLSGVLDTDFELSLILETWCVVSQWPSPLWGTGALLSKSLGLLPGVSNGWSHTPECRFKEGEHTWGHGSSGQVPGVEEGLSPAGEHP